MTDRTTAVAVPLLVSICMMATLQAQTVENTGPNANVSRELSGTLRLQTKSDKRYRGVEEWRLFVHPDGSRTIMLSKDFVAVNALQIMTAHVDPDFRPVDVHASYWVADGYRGSIRVSLDGDALRAVSEGPAGSSENVLEVPHEISVVTHGESMNGWYLWQGDRGPDGFHEATYFNLNPAPDSQTPVAGRLHPAEFQYLGTEIVTVPAGTVQTERYLLNAIEIWIASEDRILVKQTIVDEDKEYVLTRLERIEAED